LNLLHRGFSFWLIDRGLGPAPAGIFVNKTLTPFGTVAGLHCTLEPSTPLRPVTIANDKDDSCRALKDLPVMMEPGSQLGHPAIGQAESADNVAGFAAAGQLVDDLSVPARL
jgi:hypothetical protein